MSVAEEIHKQNLLSDKVGYPTRLRNHRSKERTKVFTGPKIDKRFPVSNGQLQNVYLITKWAYTIPYNHE